MILVTGASGHIGGRVAQLLTEKGERPRLMVRDVNRAPTLPESEIVLADYAEPAALNHAFADVDVALIVSGYAEPRIRAQLHKNAFDAAARAGVKHIVYLSFQGASPDSKFSMARDHFQSEQYLEATGVSFTAVRDSFYLDILPDEFDAAGVIRGPGGDGAAAFVAREDVAQVVAAVLRSPEDFEGTYDVTGPEAFTLSQVATRLGALTGRNLRFEYETLEQGRKSRSQLAMLDWEIEMVLGGHQAIAAGEPAPVSNTVQRALGREPLGLEAYFTAYPELVDQLRR